VTVLVHHRHYRELRLCNRAARDFFCKFDLDWNEFVTVGIPEDKLLATGDHFALLTVEQARREWEAKIVQS
jgi:hypothetical protein